jgi:hypothetical protein
MKFVEPRPFADPDVAARKLIEIASTIEPVQNGRIYIELVNGPFLKAGGSGDEFRAASIVRSPKAGLSGTRAGLM